MSLALIALGSNLGDRAALLDQAVDQLRLAEGIELRAISRWHGTRAVGGPAEQGEFLNGALLLDTTLSPQALLALLQRTEAAAQRQREIHWGPRTLDLDLLLYDELVLDSDELTIPHPRMMFRRFVMEPAAEVAPWLIHPGLNWRLDKLARHLALSRNYLALCGPPGVSLGMLATEIHCQLPGTLILSQAENLDLSAESGSPANAPFSITAARNLQLLSEYAAQLSRTRLGEAGLAEDDLVVSDFWLGAPLITAEAFLSPPERQMVQADWRERNQGALQPKLVVCVLPQLPTLAAEQGPDLSLSEQTPCEQPKTGEQLEQWRNAARQLLSGGSHGPWLMLAGLSPQAALTEILAAAQAMR